MRPKLRFAPGQGLNYPAYTFKTLADVCEIRREIVDLSNLSDVQFVEYSMPAFDSGKKPKVIFGSEAKSGRISICGDVLLFNKLNVRKKRIWNVRNSPNNSVCSAEFIPVIATGVLQDYMYYAVSTDKFTKTVEECSSGTSNSQKRITPSIFLEQKIACPCSQEQQKIAAFFTALDRKILTANEKLDCLIAMKRKMLNDLVTFSVRFKDGNGSRFQEPKTVRLVDLCAVFKSGNGITSANINQEGMYPVYGGNGIRGFTNTYTHDGVYVLIGRQGALCGNVRVISGKNYVSEHAIAVQANESNSTEWIGYLLDSMNLNSLSESSAQPGLSAKKLKELIVSVPCLGEQLKIAEFLKDIDFKINICRNKRDALKRLKRAFMQKMFV